MKNLRIFAAISSLALLLSCALAAHAQTVSVDEAFDLQAELGAPSDGLIATPYSDEPLTIVDPQAVLVPDVDAQEFRIRFTWEFSQQAQQTAYQILVASVGNYIDENTGDVWDSGRVAGAGQLVTVGESQTFFRALPAGTYFWKVRAWDADGTATEYTSAQRFYFIRRETALQSGEPVSPLAATGTAISSSEIRWEFTDRATNETGFALFNDRGELVVTTAPATVADYYYLIERSLKPNTAYAGRTVRAFNNAGLSGPSPAYPTVFTRAATPGELRSVRVADDKASLVIDPRGNPAGTEYAVFDSAAGSYIDSLGARATSPVWLPLELWQQATISLAHGPYALAVQARNGDRVTTPFSPVLSLDQTEAPLPVDLTLTADVLRGGAILGAQHAGATTLSGALRLITSVGPRAAAVLLACALVALGFLVHRRDRRFRGYIDTLVHVVRHDPHQVFSTHMDRDAITHGAYYFMHRFMGASVTAAVLLGLFSAGATLAERVTVLAEADMPVPALSQTIGFSDVVRFRISYAVQGDTQLSDAALSVALPPQFSLIEHSVESSKAQGEQHADANGFTIYFRTLVPAERGTLSFLAQVRPYRELGGTTAAVTATLASGARSIVTTPVTFSLAESQEQLADAVVKLPAAPDLWYIRRDGTRAYIPDMDVFAQRFGADGIILAVTQSQLELFSHDGTLRYAPGTLVRLGGSGIIYQVMDERGMLRPLTDEEVDDRLAQHAQLREISEARYADYLRK